MAGRADQSVVLKLGSRVWHAGFGGVCAPRATVDVAAAASKVLGTPCDALYSPDQRRAAHPRELQARRRDLARCLVRILRAIYQNELVCDARVYPVLLVHSPLWTEDVQEAVCGALLGNMRVPSVSFIDTHTLALLATGRNTGLVVDCGYWETIVLPIYAGRPLRNALTATPRAGRRLRAATAVLLAAFGTLQGARVAHVPNAAVERVTTEALWAEPMPRAAGAGAMSLEPDALHAALGDAKLAAIDVRTEVGVVHVPGWVRTAACEVLWDDGDEDEAGVVACVRQSLARLPIDVRGAMRDAVLLTGGTAMLPGFATRFEAQLQQPPQGAARPGGGCAVHVLNAGAPGARHIPPTPPNLLAWMGGSLAARLGAYGVERITQTAWQGAAAGDGDERLAAEG